MLIIGYCYGALTNPRKSVRTSSRESRRGSERDDEDAGRIPSWCIRVPLVQSEKRDGALHMGQQGLQRQGRRCEEYVCMQPATISARMPEHSYTFQRAMQRLVRSINMVIPICNPVHHVLARDLLLFAKYF